ncbi:ThiJ/PfpI family protein [Lophium mytilinum]|uniref:ThiJ/PfpI family protein n=1 Tax=Lophium mytilinum TaxID=390894 RepID=A0A6A6QKU3_9PEZI|nr:ThiJ/PfpI family protein [Lophium mytilinum]
MTTPLPKSYGLLLFPGFQALDAFGPLDVLNILSVTHPLSLSIIASTLSPVPTNNPVNGKLSPNFGQSVVPTHTFADPPADLEVLIVPGGMGLRNPAVVEELAQFLKGAYPKLRYVLTVCTGSVPLAASGVLERRKATTNKKAWVWATSPYANVDWVHKARWVVDGNVWTGSGVSAGIDLVLAFVEEVYGAEKAKELAIGIEYDRHEDPSYDPFADIWKITE